jgi:hypothetical protein
MGTETSRDKIVWVSRLNKETFLHGTKETLISKQREKVIYWLLNAVHVEHQSTHLLLLHSITKTISTS